jgi:hypothetical protein
MSFEIDIWSKWVHQRLGLVFHEYIRFLALILLFCTEHFLHAVSAFMFPDMSLASEDVGTGLQSDQGPFCSKEILLLTWH